MAMDIFSVNPSSFKMNKNSTFASKLKASILEKLNHCLVEYSDDVLAEYIVVLICNGKNQHQASYDLEAFLGEDSKEFVSWLWNLLLESVDRLRKPKRASYLEDEIVNGGDAVGKNKHRPRTLMGIQSHAKGDASDVLSEDEKEYCRLMLAPQPVSSNDRPKGSQHYSLESYRSSLNEIDDMEGSTKLFKHVCSKKSEPTKGALNYAPSRESESSEDTSSDSERSTSYENDDKIVRNNSADLPRPALRLPKDERPSNISKLITGDNHRHGSSSKIDVAENRSSSRPIDSVSHPNVKPRGSVWDRLGRPSVNERIVQGCRPTGEVPARDNRPVSVISNTSFADEGRRREHDLNRMRVPHHAHTMNKKRQFDAISEEEGKYRHLQYMEPPLKQLQISPSSKATRSVVLNNISSGTRRTGPLRADQALGSSVSAFIPDVNVGPQRKSCGEATDAGKTALKPVQSQLLDMKLRLHQIEMEMSKIKEKSPESNEDTSKILPSSGDLNQSKDDVESRTLYVTNVHFAATKQALSLHFVKCGVIVKVIILTDAVTLKPKGAAYITFAEKESADKGLALSGTSFWSRPLKVMRKAEMRASVIPPQVTGKPCWPHPYFARPYVGSLQWRRDQPVSSGTTEQNDTGGEERECEEEMKKEEESKESHVEEDSEETCQAA
ncbi:hypothetical protein ACHQM5_030592 [Ranunculus cassubicifolius]